MRPFYRGTCKKGDHCNYEHQVDGDGKPIPVGPELLQKYDDAVKRLNDGKAKAKSGPKGGVGVVPSMIVLAPEMEESNPVVAWQCMFLMTAML